MQVGFLGYCARYKGVTCIIGEGDTWPSPSSFPVLEPDVKNGLFVFLWAERAHLIMPCGMVLPVLLLEVMGKMTMRPSMASTEAMHVEVATQKQSWLCRAAAPNFLWGH